MHRVAVHSLKLFLVILLLTAFRFLLLLLVCSLRLLLLLLVLLFLAIANNTPVLPPSRRINDIELPLLALGDFLQLLAQPFNALCVA